VTMSRLRALVMRLRWRASRQPPVTGFDDEVELHMRLLADRYVQQGMTPEEAVQAARRQFGNVTRLQQDRRELLGFPSLERMWRAVRYGVRQLRLSPLFTATAVVSLALGIGANTAVFTLLDQLVLRLLPVAQPERLVMIWATEPNLGDTRAARASSFPLCQDYQRQAMAFDAVFCRFATGAALTLDNATEPVRAELVSGNYFEALGVGPAAGRVFTAAADDRVDRGHPVVVLSHRYWVDRFGGSVDAVGRTVLVNKNPMEVVGVAAAGFNGIDAAQAPQIWLSVRMKALLTPGEDGLHDRHYDFLQVFGRLKPPHTVASARASLQTLFRRGLEEDVKDPQIARASPFDRDRFLKRTVIVDPAATGYSEMREQYSTALIALMGMAGLIMLVACSNVASLLVARSIARRKEMALRLSIGAGRGALVGQLLVESLLLALAGTVPGLALSVVATRALLAMLPSTDALLLLRPEPDLRILLFSAGLSVATGFMFGLLPALETTKIDLVSALKAAGGGTVGAAGSARLRRLLVVAQVTLSFLLLVAAGLFARTVSNLKSVDTGLQQIGNVVSFRLDPATTGYTVPQIRALYEDVRARAQATPGVSAAAYTWVTLLQGWAPSWNMRVEGYVPRDGEDMQVANNIVSPGYWRVMGVPLLEGRDFDDRDRFAPSNVGTDPTVALVNRSFARRFFGTRSAVGRRLGVGEHKDQLVARIIGVVEDTVLAGPKRGREAQVFFSFLQANFPVAATFYVRTSLPSTAVIPTLRRIVTSRDATLPVYEMKTVERQLDDSLSAERLIASLSTVFASLATVMAALGLYGVVAFSVVRRTKEIGLRTALGAPRRSVVWLVLREVVLLLGAGLAIGVPCALLASGYVASQLFGVTPTDLSTVAVAAVTLLAVALAGGLLPARRAASIDPLKALREE
jgi:predicted permease